MKLNRRYALAAAVVTIAVVVSSALAFGGKPIGGSNYEYVKVLPKPRSGWHSPKPPENVVGVRVSTDAKTAVVGWTLWGGSGCRGSSYGRPYTYPGGDVIRNVPLNPDGTFHAIDTRAHMPKTRYHRSEMFGRFTADGSYVQLRLREKLDVEINSSSWFRCDGRWLTFRAPLKGGGG